MFASPVLLVFATITGIVAAWEASGCCFSIGYAAFMEPCCLKTESKGQSECLQHSKTDMDGIPEVGWNPSCPSSSKEAGEWLTALQANPINCPDTEPTMGVQCSGSQSCKYQVRVCPDGERLYNNASKQCSGEKAAWDADAHVCLDGTEQYKIHALCVNGEWVVNTLRLECQDCPANLQTLGDAGSCSLVTKGDAEVAAHNINTCMVIGGTLIDGSPKEYAVVDGPAYVQQLGTPGLWNFNSGGPFKNASVDFAKLESLVSSPKLQNYTDGDYSLFVVNSGGTFHQGMFGGGDPHDNGKTLVVFNTEDAITITASDSGRQFGPSILAPFSEVTLLGKAGYIDGCVIARSFKTAGKDAGGLKLHGDCFRGPLCSTKVPHKNKWWLWLVGVGSGLAAAAIAVPLAVHYTTTTPSPCAIVNPLLLTQKSAYENSDYYKLGREFGSTWPYTILFGLVFVVVVMSIAIVKFRHARLRRRDARATPSISSIESQEGEELALE